MMTLRNGALALTFAAILFVSGGVESAHAASIDDMLKTIQSLMTQIQELQRQLNTVRGEVKTVLKDGLSEGMTDSDITKIQELLATDVSIYPEGKKTGYFGPLTREALKRFQARHELEVTGTVDSETRDLLEEYLHEGFGDTIPPGLLRAPGIMKKVEMRFEMGCGDKGQGHGMGPLCKKLKMEHGDDGDDDDDDSATSSTFEDVTVEIDGGSTTVSFSFDGDDYEVEVHSTNRNTVLAAVADELDVTVSELDAKLVKEIKKELENAINDVADTSESDAQGAIDDAKDTIDEAQNDIDDASGDTSDADDLLDEANTKLDKAENAFDDEDWADAEDFAHDAESLANDASDAL